MFLIFFLHFMSYPVVWAILYYFVHFRFVLTKYTVILQFNQKTKSVELKLFKVYREDERVKWNY